MSSEPGMPALLIIQVTSRARSVARMSLRRIGDVEAEADALRIERDDRRERPNLRAVA